MDVKTTFLNINLEEDVYMIHNLQVLKIQGMLGRYASKHNGVGIFDLTKKSQKV
jgi:hypothetical protein